MEDILYSILTEGDSVLAWLAAGAVGLLMKWLKTKIDSESLSGLVSRALAEVQDAVAEVYQTYIEDLKAARLATSPGGSRLTDEEKEDAMEHALAIAKGNIGSKGLQRLLRVLGLQDEDELDGWLETKAEASIAGFKAASTNPPEA